MNVAFVAERDIREKREGGEGAAQLFGTMAGRRSLTPEEERRLLRVLRRMHARDRALITAQWLTGFRISEIFSLTVGAVYRNGAVVEKIGVAPKHLKGHYGRTHWVPVLPELHRALSTWLNVMARRWEMTPDLPLFLSRKGEKDGAARPLDRGNRAGGVRAPPLSLGMNEKRRGRYAIGRSVRARN